MCMCATAPAARSGSVPVKAEYSARREDIDGLRAIACLMVVLFHMDSSWLPGGYMGVDVFFVISGYVVTLSLSRAWRSKRASPLVCCASFYARRICRLSPLVLATVVVTALAMSVFVQARDGIGAVAVAGLEVPTDAESLQGFYVTGIFALFGGTNVWLATQATGGYWGHGRASAEWNPFTHFWSLGVEEQFYLAFPPIYLTIRCLGDRRPRAAAGVVALLCVGSVALSLALQTRTPIQDANLAFYLMPNRAWELMFGACLDPAVRTLITRRLLTPARQVALEVAAAATLGTAIALQRSLLEARNFTLFPAPAALLACGGTAAYIAAGACRGRLHLTRQTSLSVPVLNSLLSARGFVYAGKLSYSVYLWHWPVFVLARWTVGFQCVPVKVAALAVALLLAVASHHAIERPMMRAAGASARRGHIAIALLIGSTAVAGLLLVLRGPLLGRLYLGNEDNHYRTPFIAAISGHQGPGGPLSTCDFQSPRAGLYNQQDEKASAGCYSTAAYTAYALDRPRLEAAGGGRTLHLLGDSHTGNWATAAQAALAVLGAPIRTSGKWVQKEGYAFTPYEYSSSDTAESEAADVAKAVEVIEQTIRPALYPGDILLFASWLHNGTPTPPPSPPILAAIAHSQPATAHSQPTTVHSLPAAAHSQPATAELARAFAAALLHSLLNSPPPCMQASKASGSPARCSVCLIHAVSGHSRRRCVTLPRR